MTRTTPAVDHGSAHRDAASAQRRIGPVAVDVATRAGAIAAIEAHVTTARPFFVTFCNAHSVNTAYSVPAFAAALDDAYVLNDGTGLDIASRLLFGQPFPENLNGTDFTPDLLAALSPARVFLLGSAAGVAEHAAEALAACYPRHAIVGVRDGFFDDADTPVILAAIATSGANLVLVGMGQPRQELWAGANWRNIAGVTMCVGAFLDFTAGVVPRAPGIFRQARSEWLYRLAVEPRRLWRRYLIGNVEFLGRCFVQRIRHPGRSAQKKGR